MSVVYTYKNNILVVCNVINVIYHFPQIIKTYKTKSVKDFDPYYLFLVIFIVFVGYCIVLKIIIV